MSGPPSSSIHGVRPVTDDDATIAAALEDVSVPSLLCSLVHATGDPSWIRMGVGPRQPASSDLQAGMPDDEQRRVRELALPAIAAYRDGGSVPHPVDRALAVEMMAFLGGRPVEGRLAEFFLHEIDLDGADPGAVRWGSEVTSSARAASPVVVIGAGMGGLLAGIRLAEAGLPFTIVDANPGPGGTWWENRYPGARVDVGSHQYCYSFASYDWSEFYCRQPELQAYFEHIVDLYDLRSHCRFGTRVESIGWDADAHRWQVRCRAGDGAPVELAARFVVSAVGALNIPRLPDIPGADTFAGPAFHSARWPADLDLDGVRLALVGAGASGFQIGPAVADRVEHLTVFQRTAQWVLPNPLYHQPVPAGEHWALRHLPAYGRWVRFARMFPGVAAGTAAHRVDPDYVDPDGPAINAANAKRRDAMLGWMRSLLGDRPDLWEKVVPDYPFMGKRILQDDGTWFRTLRRPDVSLVRTPIEAIEPDAVVTADGTRHLADVICFATGFRHNDFLASLEVTGRGGRSLRARWGNEPEAYLGMTVPEFPNLFMIYGPGTNLAHSSSLFIHAESQVTYILDAIHHTLAAGATTIEVTEAAHDDYAARLQDEIGQLVWAHPSIEHSHYKNPDGKVYTLSPWPVDQYWEWTTTVDPADYTLT